GAVLFAGDDAWNDTCPSPARRPARGRGMSLALYIVGFVVLIGGLAMAAVELGVPQSWIVIGLVVLVGIGLIGIASTLRNRLPPGPDQAAAPLRCGTGPPARAGATRPAPSLPAPPATARSPAARRRR